MGMRSVRVRFLLILLAAVLTACGGGGGGGGGKQPPVEDPLPPIVMGSTMPSDVHWLPPSGATPTTGNFVYLGSEAGEKIGQGENRLHTDADSTIAYQYGNGQHQFSIGHPQRQWSLVFMMIAPPRTGLYSDARKPVLRTSSNDAGINVTTEGRECEVVDGWFVIDQVVSGSDGLEFIAMRFGLRCAGATTALHGQLRWSRADARRGPISPSPAGLWQPPSSAVPARGSYLYLESDAGDYVGAGRTRLFTKKDAALDVVYVDGFPVRFYSVAVRSRFEAWTGNFIGINEIPLRQGYYPGVQRYPYNADGVGAMEWSRDGLGCGMVNGWYAVDEVEYVGNIVAYLELRFEQRCDLSGATLRGKVVWSALEFLPPPGPVDPAPATLWQPPVGATPASGDYVYLQSEAGDSIGLGRTRLYTPGNAVMQATPYGRHFLMRVSGDADWSGDFTTMSSAPSLAQGYYSGLPATAAADSSNGSLAWKAGGLGCRSSSTGWVAVDRVDLASDGTIATVEMRFEQRCAGDAGALRGKIRWTASTTSAVIRPAPDLLWRPPAGALPMTGNYVYVESDYGDPIGLGLTSLDTPRDAVLSASGSSEPGAYAFLVSVFNGGTRWNGRFHPPVGAGQLQTGLYGNVLSDGASLVAGGMDWSGNAATCVHHASGWYAVDAVTYSGTELSSIELRFEYRCNEWSSALRGAVRWSASDMTSPPGPTQAPQGLWQPATGSTPDTGNYVYLESQYGEPVGQGRTALFTAANAALTAYVPENDLRLFHVSVDEHASPSFGWGGDFMAMDSLTQLKQGFYGGVGRYPFQNPARGGIEVIGNNWFCNVQSGWFMVDQVSIADNLLQSIELRFEQHCDRRSAPLRGKIRWSRG